MQVVIDVSTVDAVMNRIFSLTYEAYVKTHSYHWNIVSSDFIALHDLFAQQYESLWRALDDTAERLRVFGLAAPSVFPSVRTLPFGTMRREMLQNLIESHDTTISVLRSSIVRLQEAGDEAGADFLIGRLTEHEKMAWMLRSSM